MITITVGLEALQWAAVSSSTLLLIYVIHIVRMWATKIPESEKLVLDLSKEYVYDIECIDKRIHKYMLNIAGKKIQVTK